MTTPDGPRGKRPKAPPRPGYHDPLHQAGGAPSAQSALTLRLVLAAVGLVLFAGGAIAAAVRGALALAIVLAVIALTALVDLVVIIRRKVSGEPG